MTSHSKHKFEFDYVLDTFIFPETTGDAKAGEGNPAERLDAETDTVTESRSGDASHRVLEGAATRDAFQFDDLSTGSTGGTHRGEAAAGGTAAGAAPGPVDLFGAPVGAAVDFKASAADGAGKHADGEAVRPGAGISASMVLPTDPLLSNQWHLIQTVAGRFDLNVRGVWDPAQGPSYTGFGIRVVVVDDGFDYNHSDFDNYDQGLDFDWDANNNGDNGNHDLDPFGLPGDAHGTAVTGIINANDDGNGAVGVAFNASVVGYRTHGFITDGWLRDIRDSIHHAAVTTLGSVVNISQGIANDANSEFGVGYVAARFDEIETSIATAVNQGRGGLGTTIVKSAGNSRGDNYDVNADDWTNDTRQVVVAAVNQDGFVSSYSSYGAANLVSAFGTPGEVITTDRVGAAGYTGTDFTTFNGTSAAAPMVSGVVALMYDANSALGWRDVQSILANSARQVGSEVGAGITGSERFPWQWNDATTWNGGGLHFSNDYGYGLVDGLAAVRLAETWLLAPGTSTAATTSNQFTNLIDMLNVALVIPDGNTGGLTFGGNAVFDDIVERVTVQMTFSTTFTGDLEVYVTGPNGTVNQLIADTGGTNDFNGTWTFESQAFRGERAGGNWLVRVVDDAGADVLTVSDIKLTTWGAFTSNDRYVFTNEYSDYDGISGHRNSILDTNGGTDTVNAAAVTSDSTIYLDGRTGSIDGAPVSFQLIEHAIGGDGDDTLKGNDLNNSLFGMRGNDWLEGGLGNDTHVGGFGDDIYVVNTGSDIVVETFGQGFDIVLARANYGLGIGVNVEYLSTAGTAGFESIDLNGNELSQTLVGNQGVNWLDGKGGIDTLYGLGGNDFFIINHANDVVVELAGGGTDRVLTRVSYNLGAAADIEVFSTAGTSGTGAIDLKGNSLGQTIIGNNGVNIIEGEGGADILYGMDGADTLAGDAADDTIRGGAGNDAIAGGAGKDFLWGEGGRDLFAYYFTTDSQPGGGSRDVIGDFATLDDWIHLTNMDANTTVGGDQAFNWVGGSAVFSGAAGELHYFQVGLTTYIEGDVDGDANEDFQIELAGKITLTIDNFFV